VDAAIIKKGVCERMGNKVGVYLDDSSLQKADMLCSKLDVSRSAMLRILIHLATAEGAEAISILSRGGSEIVAMAEDCDVFVLYLSGRCRIAGQ
jgi:hypothetical protein